GAAEIDLTLDAGRAPAPMTAIAPVGPAGRFDFTQKTVLIPAEGEVRAGNIRFPVRNQLAGIDFTHGYLARDTAWRWAFGAGRAWPRLCSGWPVKSIVLRCRAFGLCSRVLSGTAATSCLNRLFALVGAGADVRRRAAIVLTRSPKRLARTGAVTTSGQSSQTHCC